MIISSKTARHEWATRVALQAEQLLILALAANDDDMREELLADAARLEEHAKDIASIL